MISFWELTAAQIAVFEKVAEGQDADHNLRTLAKLLDKGLIEPYEEQAPGHPPMTFTRYTVPDHVHAQWRQWVATRRAGRRSKPSMSDRIGTRRAVLQFIIDYKLAHDGNAPTIRQIMESCDISATSVVAAILNQLEDRGCIRRHPVTRAIEVIGGQWLAPSMDGRQS